MLKQYDILSRKFWLKVLASIFNLFIFLPITLLLETIAIFCELILEQLDKLEKPLMKKLDDIADYILLCDIAPFYSLWWALEVVIDNKMTTKSLYSKYHQSF